MAAFAPASCSSPTIVLGPGDPAQFHVVDEHITIQQLVRGVEVYRGLIGRLA